MSGDAPRHDITLALLHSGGTQLSHDAGLIADELATTLTEGAFAG